MEINSMSTLFSVLIANYNNGIYLEDAISSVYKQTYKNWEIIIVDDKSTDNSTDIYKKYNSDSRIHVFYNDINHGCGYTKRRCAELAHGEICGFLDPDDTLETEALETMVKVHEADESLSMVYSRYNEVDEKLHTIMCNLRFDLFLFCLGEIPGAGGCRGKDLHLVHAGDSKRRDPLIRFDPALAHTSSHNVMEQSGLIRKYTIYSHIPDHQFISGI